MIAATIFHTICFAVLALGIAGTIEAIYKIYIAKHKYKVLYISEKPTIIMYRLKDIDDGEEFGPCYWLPSERKPMPYADGSVLTLTVSQAESQEMFRG